MICSVFGKTSVINLYVWYCGNWKNNKLKDKLNLNDAGAQFNGRVRITKKKYTKIQFNTKQYNTIQYNTIQCNTTQYNITLSIL